MLRCAAIGDRLPRKADPNPRFVVSAKLRATASLPLGISGRLGLRRCKEPAPELLWSKLISSCQRYRSCLPNIAEAPQWSHALATAAIVVARLRSRIVKGPPIRGQFLGGEIAATSHILFKFKLKDEKTGRRMDVRSQWHEACGGNENKKAVEQFNTRKMKDGTRIEWEERRRVAEGKWEWYYIIADRVEGRWHFGEKTLWDLTWQELPSTRLLVAKAVTKLARQEARSRLCPHRTRSLGLSPSRSSPLRVRTDCRSLVLDMVRGCLEGVSLLTLRLRANRSRDSPSDTESVGI